MLAVAVVGSTGVLGSSARAAACEGNAHPGGEWPSYGQDLSNARSQEAESAIGPATVAGLQPAWSYTPPGPENIRTTAVVAGGCVFVTSFGPGPGLGTSATGTVSALDADSGEVVWQVRLPAGPGLVPGIFAPAVAYGRVYVGVSQAPVPYVTALDQATGAEVWTTYLYEGLADGEVVDGINASMVVFDGLVFVPLYGTDSFNFSHPSFYVLDAADGKRIKKTTVIPREDWLAGYSGGGIWTTGAVDTRNKYVYVGTANPYNKRAEHAHTNSLLKIDLDRDRYTTFGQVVGVYKGEYDYDPELYNSPQCRYLGEVVPVGYSTFCGQKDVDFGASPNLFRTSGGRLVVGDLQKTCTYHAVDAATMKLVWAARGLGPGGASGCAATSAYDGSSLYLNVNDGVLYALDKDTGAVRWQTSYGDVGAHYQPVTVANGVVYTVGNTGRLYAFDAATGQLLVERRIEAPGTACEATAGAGVTVARNTVFVACDTQASAVPTPVVLGGLLTGPQPGLLVAYRLPS